MQDTNGYELIDSMNRERERIGRGMEQTVLKPLSEQNGREIILKKPHGYTVWTLNHFFDGVNTVRKEINETKKLIEKTAGRVQIPGTRIFPFGKGYVAVQDYIEDDGTIADIRGRLVAEDLPELVKRYDKKTVNFVSSNNVIYLLDPTLSPLSRLNKLLNEKLGIDFTKLWILKSRFMRRIKSCTKVLL